MRLRVVLAGGGDVVLFPQFNDCAVEGVDFRPFAGGNDQEHRRVVALGRRQLMFVSRIPCSGR